MQRCYSSTGGNPAVIYDTLSVCTVCFLWAIKHEECHRYGRLEVEILVLSALFNGIA